MIFTFPLLKNYSMAELKEMLKEMTLFYASSTHDFELLILFETQFLICTVKLLTPTLGG